MMQEPEDSKPFILFASQSDDNETRKFIRRHVMLGKNRGKTHPNRRKPVHKPKQTTREKEEKFPAARNHDKSLSDLPRQVGSNLSSIAWPDSVDVSTMAVIMDFTHYTKKNMHPIDSCIDFPAKDVRWLEPLITDAAWVHMMAFTSHAYMNVLRGHSTWPVGTRTSPHFVKSLRILRERLQMQGQFNDEEDRRVCHMVLTNSTVQVVTSLATYAILHGEFAEARCHLQGLRQIVKLRGGFDGFRPWPKLIIEILRTDLDLALHTGFAPVFFQGAPERIQWPHSVYAFPHLSGCANLTSPPSPGGTILEYLHPDLAQGWIVLDNFCTEINSAAITKSRLTRDLLVDTMASATYHLLRLQYAPGSLDELVRLSLLTFGSGIFLQWHLGLPMGPTYFSSTVQENLRLFDSALLQADASTDDDYFLQRLQQQLLLVWVLFTAAMVFCQEDSAAWFRARLKTQMLLCGINNTRSWDDVAPILRGFPWIDIVHERPARRVLDEVFAMNALMDNSSIE